MLAKDPHTKDFHHAHARNNSPGVKALFTLPWLLHQQQIQAMTATSCILTLTLSGSLSVVNPQRGSVILHRT